MLTTDIEAARTIRQFLDDYAYAYVSHRAIPNGDTQVWPPFQDLQRALQVTNPFYRFLFSFFRQGHVADEEYVRGLLPARVFDALVTTGLIHEPMQGEWRTCGYGIVPVEGLYLVASLPPSYPTAVDKKQPIYLGLESIWLTKAFSVAFRGKSVVDLCTGSGIQGLLAAARGARRVVGLELSAHAVSVARFNAALNGLEDVVEIRESNLFSAVAGERFDVLLSNPPFMPVVEDVGYPICGDGGIDGTTLLRPLFADLVGHLTDSGEAWLFCNALGSQSRVHVNEELLRPLVRDHGVGVRAFVHDKGTIDDYVRWTLEPNLKNTSPTISAAERAAHIAGWRERLAEKRPDTTYVYSQILHLRRQAADASLREFPIYDPHETDPLVVAVKSWALST